MKPLILLVEDDLQIRRFLRAALSAEGYRFQEAATAKEGLTQAAAHRPDFILLDLGLPDQDGLEVIRGVREWSTVPILVLSARGRERDKIEALDLGADDYVAKPFTIGEVLARIRAGLRRSSAVAPGAIFRFGQIEVDFDKRVVKVHGEEVHLTPNEYKLLQVLSKHAGKVLTQRQLLQEVWGYKSIPLTRTVDVHIAWLRQKIEEDAKNPKYIVTVHGQGYRFSK